MTLQYDIAIIGGGVAGLSVAAQLPKAMRVILLEAEPQLCYHSSGRSAALYTKSYGPKPIRELTAASELFFNAAHDAIDGQPLLAPRGELMIAPPEKQDRIEALLAEVGEGFGARIIEPHEAEALHPLLDAARLGPCFWDASAQDIDVDLLLTLYRKLALGQGAKLVTNARVQAMAFDGGAWQISTTNAENVSARIAVNCAGAWGDQVGEMAGAAPVGLVPKRRSMGVVPLPQMSGLDRAPMAIEIDEGFYIKAEAGRLLVSPADQTPVEPHDAFADDQALAEACWNAEQLTRLQVTRMESSWGGLRTFAPDGDPVIGWDNDVPNFLWSVGQGGYGIQTSPAWGMTVVDAVYEFLE